MIPKEKAEHQATITGTAVVSEEASTSERWGEIIIELPLEMIGKTVEYVITEKA